MQKSLANTIFFPIFAPNKQSLMKKKTLILAVAAMLLTAMSSQAMPMMMELGVAEQIDEPAPTMTVEGNIVSINGGGGQTLEVASLTGRAVATYKIEGPAQRVELNLPKGCYILKVGKTVRKITVR
jgi:hypothetical protein